MTWRSFVDFWCMRELSQEDTIMRNYDITRYTGKGETHLWLALKRIGLSGVQANTVENYVPEVAQMLANIGPSPIPEFERVRVRLIGWYTWDRIRKGELSSWFLSEMVKRSR